MWYEADPTSYVEDEHRRQMDYRSRQPSPYSATVTLNKDEKSMGGRKFKNHKVIRYASGATFDVAMMHATILLPEADEPLDMQ